MTRDLGGIRYNTLWRATCLHVVLLLMCGSALTGRAQVNSGSDGSDGAFNPTNNVVIDMADHPTGIYKYSSVNVPTGVTVSFTPNGSNTPVVWLAQSNVVISGTVDVSGQGANEAIGGSGGPGGWAGGSGGSVPTAGQGPGGGTGGSGSYATLATPSSGTIYGNQFILPLMGGSGGGGVSNTSNGGGGGGGGAILIAASGQIQLNGVINAAGGMGDLFAWGYGGSGSGGGVRLVASKISGTGTIAAGRTQADFNGYDHWSGSGRVRFDIFENDFGGTISGDFSQGFQPIIIPVAGQGAQLTIASVAGASVSATPNGQLVSPDTIISGQQANPVSIVVNCANIPLNTQITVSVKPANGPTISAVGYNTTGTPASSTATVSLNIPRGGGIIYATAATSN